ncbi:MAG: hypothetical protein WCF68_21290 [Terriglobales bacterium]
MEWSKLKAHPAADMFPLMGSGDLESLANNIRLSGQLFPITLTKDGLILDGRNRLAAYKRPALKGLEPWILTYEGSLTPMDYVRSVNWERMHLNPSQRAQLAVLLLPEAQRKAAERQGKRNDLTSGSGDPNVENGRAVEVVAKQMGVSPAQVKRAARIQKENPAAAERIKEGKSTVRTEHSKLPKKTSRKTTAPKSTEKSKSEEWAAEVDKLAQMRLEKLQKASLWLLDGVTAAAYADAEEYYVEALTDVQQTLAELIAGIKEEVARRNRVKAHEQAEAA